MRVEGVGLRVESTMERRTARVKSSMVPKRAQCLCSILSTKWPVRGCVRNANTLYIIKRVTTSRVLEGHTTRYRQHAHNPSTRKCSNAQRPTSLYVKD